MHSFESEKPQNLVSFGPGKSQKNSLRMSVQTLFFLLYFCASLRYVSSAFLVLLYV